LNRWAFTIAYINLGKIFVILITVMLFLSTTTCTNNPQQTNTVDDEILIDSRWSSFAERDFSNTCIDENGDGICSESFVIGNNAYNFPLNLTASNTSPGDLELLWTKYGRVGRAFATCVIGSIVYVVGYSFENNFVKGIIEARDTSTGDLLYTWENVYGEITVLHDCVTLGNYLFIVGWDNAPGNDEWLVLKFTPSLELLEDFRINPSEGSDWAYAIATDGLYLYIGGDVENEPDDYQAGIIKINPANFSILWEWIYNPTNGWDYVVSIAISPYDLSSWVVVSVNNSVAEIFVYKNDQVIGWRNLDDYCSQLAFDENGYAYLACLNSLQRASSNLEITKLSSNVPTYKTVYVKNYIYFLSLNFINDYSRLVVLRAARDLSIVNALPLTMDINADSYTSVIGKATTDGIGLYVAGYYRSNDKFYWVTSAVSITTPVTMTTTITTTVTQIETSTTIIPITTTYTTTVSTVTTFTITTTTTRTETSTTTTLITTTSPITTTYTTTIPQITTMLLTTTMLRTITESTTMTATSTLTTTTIITSRDIRYSPITYTVVEKPWFSKESVALLISLSLVVSSAFISVWLRKMR